MISIDTLPDEALLAIFDFCLGGHQDLEDIKTWQSLIHVCRRWRSIVFGSPRRLNLRIAGTPKTPVRDLLGVWPDLPIVIRDTYTIDPIEGLYNIIALLEHSHRVCKIHLGVPSSHFEEVSAAMEVPFPELTELELTSYDLVGRVPADSVLRDSFLGGSAPHLRRLALTNLLFPGLPKLLLSATHLVELFLFDLPLSEYISPEMLVIALSARPTFDYFRFDSNPLNLAMTRHTDDFLPRHCRHALSFPFSHFLGSRGSVNTWKTSWPASMPLYSATFL